MIHQTVKALQECLTRVEFNSLLEEKGVTLMSICPEFWKYFSNFYLNPGSRFPPEIWGSFLKKNLENRTNNIVESKNRIIKQHIGRGLSDLSFLIRAKQFTEAQSTLLSTEFNQDWSDVLSTPMKRLTIGDESRGSSPGTILNIRLTRIDIPKNTGRRTPEKTSKHLDFDGSRTRILTSGNMVNDGMKTI